MSSTTQTPAPVPDELDELPPVVMTHMAAPLLKHPPQVPWRQSDRLHVEWVIRKAIRMAEYGFRHAQGKGVPIWEHDEWTAANDAAWRVISEEIAPDDPAVAYTLFRRAFAHRLEQLCMQGGEEDEGDTGEGEEQP